MTNLADTLPEPADGTRLAVRSDKGVWWVVWRDDAESTEDEMHRPGEHWFEAFSSFPMSWRDVMENATEAYAIVNEPLAQLTTDPAAAKVDFEAWKARVIAANPPPKFITFNEQPPA